jgi:CHAT domain-containing protein
MDYGDWETLRDEAIALQDDPDIINFADPYYWAAFTLTGRGTP